MGDATKIVIAKVMEKEDCYEVIHVYGNNEDFDVMCNFPLRIPALYTKVGVDKFLERHNPRNLPVYSCTLSHDMNVMGKEEAFEKILDATELWTGSDRFF